MKDWQWLLLVGLGLFLFTRQVKAIAAENDEEWTLVRDDRGKLQNIKIHRVIH